MIYPILVIGGYEVSDGTKHKIAWAWRDLGRVFRCCSENEVTLKMADNTIVTLYTDEAS